MNDGTWYALGNPNVIPPFTKLAQHYDIKESSLRYYRKKLLENINWLPDQGNSLAQQIFSPAEQDAIAKKLLDLADKGVPVTNQVQRLVILEEAHKKYEAESDYAEIKMKNFNASDKYLRNFRKSHNLSMRKAHLKRRPDAADDRIHEFRERMKMLQIREEIKARNILNCDETFWRDFQQSNRTIARKGQDNVHIYTNANEKAGTTVLATIDADGQKLPLVLVGKGKTEKCEKSQFGFSNPFGQSNPNPYTDSIHYTTHSENGWMNNKIFPQYLNMLREQRPYDPQQPKDSIENRIFLTCDSFAAHHDSIAQMEAEKLNIELIRIPEGCTDECQPLDRRIFGNMKSQATAHFNKEIVKNYAASQESNTPFVMKQQTKKESTKLLFDLWDKFPQTQISKAWDLAIYGREKGENEDV